MKKRPKRHYIVFFGIGCIFIMHAMDQGAQKTTVLRPKTPSAQQINRKKERRIRAEQFWEKTELYRNGFASFVESKVGMARTFVISAPGWVTSVVNTGLGLVGSEYTLDERELLGLDRYFQNSEKKCEYLATVKINKLLLKDIFDEFGKAEQRKFKHLKPILETKVRACLPGIDEPDTRAQLNEDVYFSVMTTSMFATFLYDQGFTL